MKKITLALIVTMSTTLLFISPKITFSQTDTTNLYDLDLEALMNIDIYSVSKKAESLFDAPLSASVLTAEEIEKSGATSIPEALRLIPGLIVREKTTGNYDVHIRGNDNVLANKLNYSENTMSLVMIDNRVVFSYFQGGTFWETLPVSIQDIDRIEVVRGPATALYGPNAVMGVIHIITKGKPEEKFTADADLQAGTLNSKIASVNIGTSPSDKVGFRLSGNYTFLDRSQNNYYSFHHNRYVPYDSLSILQQQGYPPEPLVSDPEKYFPDHERATDKYAANFYAYFHPDEKLKFDLAAGLQNSTVQTIYLDNGVIPMNTRESNTKYVNFQSGIYGFNARLSYMGGEQNLALGDPNFHYDMEQLDAVLEYDFVWKDLTIRPGISYQNSVYDVGPYTSDNQMGFFEGSKDLNTLSFYLRTEYLMFQKLKLIAAVRNDIYNKPDDDYFSFQFGSSYKVDDKNLIRVVYSRANQGPFMLDTYTNLKFPVFPPNVFFELYGNENLDLATSDMFEIGYRSKLTDKIQADFETFYSVTKDFAIAVVDKTNPLKAEYQNLPLKSRQFGLTGNLNLAISDKIRLKGFGTLQLTALEDLDTKIDHSGYGYDTVTYARVDLVHKSTPTFYGGAMINYTPLDRLNIFANVYFYGEQTFLFDNTVSEKVEQFNIESNAIVDMKISYNIWKSHSIYVNARNLFNDQKKQFAFGDDGSGLYLVGLNLSF